MLKQLSKGYSCEWLIELLVDTGSYVNEQGRLCIQPTVNVITKSHHVYIPPARDAIQYDFNLADVIKLMATEPFQLITNRGMVKFVERPLVAISYYEAQWGALSSHKRPLWFGWGSIPNWYFSTEPLDFLCGLISLYDDDLRRVMHAYRRQTQWLQKVKT